MEKIKMSKNEKRNLKALRDYAVNAKAKYNSTMGWLLKADDGHLYTISEPQGQTDYVGGDEVLGTWGDVYQAHGNGFFADGNLTDQYGKQDTPTVNCVIAKLMYSSVKDLAEYVGKEKAEEIIEDYNQRCRYVDNR